MLRSIAILALSTALAAQGPLPDLGTSTTPAQSVRGTVTRNGEAVSGAKVHVAWRRIKVELGASARALETTVRSVETDAEGKFELRVPAWRKLSAWAVHGDDVSAYEDGIELPADALELELAPGKALRGRFVLDGKAPAAPVRFSLDRLGATKTSVPLRRDAESAADGSFSITGLPAGQWQLRTRTDERGLRPSTIHILDGEATQEVELVRGASANVRFTRVDGSPDADAQIEVLGFATRGAGVTDAEGRVTLHGLQRGHGTDLLITPRVGPRRYFTLEPGMEVDADGVPDVEIRGHAASAVEGTLYGIDSKALVGAEVAFCGTIHGAGYPPADFSHIVKTDAQGRYRCEQLDKNVVFQVYAIVDGEHQPIGTVDPRPQFFRSKLDAFRVGSRRVTVRVDLPGGGPHNYEVRVYGPKESAAPNSYATLARDAKGQWVSPSLLQGEYVFAAFSKTLGFATTKHIVRATSTGRASEALKMRLTQPKVVEGVVLRGNRQALAGAKVALVFEGANFENAPTGFDQSIARVITDEHWPADKFPLSAKTDAAGKFRFVSYHSGALLDIIATRDDAPAGESTPPPTRLTRALSLPTPITVVIR